MYRYQEDTFAKNMTAFTGEIDKSAVKSARQHIPTLIGIITGLRPDDKRVALKLIRSQTEATRDRDFAGFSYFFYGSLLDCIKQIASILMTKSEFPVRISFKKLMRILLSVLSNQENDSLPIWVQ